MTRYAVFCFVPDRIRLATIPVVVLAWSAEAGWHKVRFIRPGESLAGLQPTDYQPYVTLVQENLTHWDQSGELPYADQKHRPSEDGWWLHVRKLLNHEIWLSEPKAL